MAINKKFIARILALMVALSMFGTTACSKKTEKLPTNDESVTESTTTSFSESSIEETTEVSNTSDPYEEYVPDIQNYEDLTPEEWMELIAPYSVFDMLETDDSPKGPREYIGKDNLPVDISAPNDVWHFENEAELETVLAPGETKEDLTYTHAGATTPVTVYVQNFGEEDATVSECIDNGWYYIKTFTYVLEENAMYAAQLFDYGDPSEVKFMLMEAPDFENTNGVASFEMIEEENTIIVHTFRFMIYHFDGFDYVTLHSEAINVIPGVHIYNAMMIQPSFAYIVPNSYVEAAGTTPYNTYD